MGEANLNVNGLICPIDPQWNMRKSTVNVKSKGLWVCLDVLKCLYLAYYCKQNG